MEIVSKPVMVTDISADVVEPQFSAELLQEQIADVEEPLFVQWNTGKRGKRDRNFFPALVVEQSFFFRFFLAGLCSVFSVISSLSPVVSSAGGNASGSFPAAGS